MQAILTILGALGLGLAATAQEPPVTIESPAADASVFYSVSVRVQADGIDWLTLWLDDQPVVSLREPPYTWTLDMLDQPLGPHRIEVEYAQDGVTQRLSRNVLRIPDIPEAKLPAEELPRWGVHVGKDALVTFVVDAPAARFVSLIGDFNEWDPAADVMTPTGDGRWWMRKTLRKKETVFQYMVDGDGRMADPFSREVRWRGTDRTTAKTVIRPLPPRPFVWTDRSYKRPALRNLVLYEMAVGDVSTNRGFKALSQRLNKLKGLGINAVELMPLMEYPGEALKGYNPTFYFAVENSYGTPRALKTFVNQAHHQGIAVVLDLALHQLDTQKEKAREQVEAVLEYWVREFHIDGVRYHAAETLDWAWIAYIADVEDPDLFQFADHQAPGPELLKDTYLDAVWENKLSERLRNGLRSATLDPEWAKEWINAGETGYERGEQRVLFVENHSQDRLSRMLREADYSDEEVIRRVVTAHALLLTVPGVVLLHAGQDFGERRANTDKRLPLDWRVAGRPPYRSLHQHVASLIRLRRDHPACRQDKIRLLRSDAKTGVLVYQRHAPGAGIVVAANLGQTKQEVEIPLPADWQWHDVLSGSDFKVAEETGARVTLAPGQTRVFTTTAPP